MLLIIHSVTSAEKKHEQRSFYFYCLILLFFVIYLRKKKEHKKSEEYRKEKGTKQTLALNENMIIIYKIKVRNKQQEKRMSPTKMLVNENEKTKEINKRQQTVKK